MAITRDPPIDPQLLHTPPKSPLASEASNRDLDIGITFQTQIITEDDSEYVLDEFPLYEPKSEATTRSQAKGKQREGAAPPPGREYAEGLLSL